MARSPEHSEDNSTLPQPELNPLLNPVLGQHMGRWAEVYFTSPPEKREEAVLQLLRELERNPPPPESSPIFRNEVIAGPPAESFPELNPAFATGGEFLVCVSCGQQSPPSQLFCGRCGLPLHQESLSNGTDRAGNETDPHDWPAETWPTEAATTPAPAREGQPAEPQSGHSAYDHAAEEPLRPLEAAPANIYDYPRRPSWAYEEEIRERARHDKRIAQRNRISMLAALLLLLATLVYMAGRGMGAWSGQSHATSKAPMPATAPDGVPSSVPVTSKTPIPSAPETAVKSATANPVPPKPAHPVAIPATPSTPVETQPTPTGTGSEELATAQQYLNGAPGQARDGGEAAKWLWKAVAKQNTTAAVLLSDLYLRGDGVTKNCDQARLLLDAAARKNTPGAADRIRNLQAFGCQ